MENTNSILLGYANQNLPYKDIACLLEKIHGLTLSPNAIRKRLKRLGYPSRRGPTIHATAEVKQALAIELQNNPVTVGYRHMTVYYVTEAYMDTVMMQMKEMDFDGVNFRRRRRICRKVYRSLGPNYVWHVDGYDKLKPYGFAVHGCIDGYSRRILWLKVACTNNNPKVVATNFVKCVEEIKGCPVILQTDPGTENCVLGAIQCVFRQNHTDFFSGERSVRIVKSKFNQRVEAWWSIFRRHKTQWWMDLFKDLELFGAFEKRNITDVYCLRYCFMPLLQQEFDTVAKLWNSHYISKSRQASCPGGRPIVLFNTPQKSGGDDCICHVQEDDVQWAFGQCEIESRSGSEEFDAFAYRIFDRQNFIDAKTADEALHQYFYLHEKN